MNWHYAKDGQQLGPISEDELKQLYASGEITAKDLIWREGLGDWVSYVSVFSEAQPAEGAGPLVAAEPAATHSESSAIPGFTGGTGGQTPNPDLRAAALASLKGNWGPAIGVVLVGYLLMMVGSFIPILGFFVMIACSGPLVLGVIEYFLRRSRNTDPEFGVLFNGFSNFLLGFLLYVLLYLISMVVTLVAAIPGGILMGVSAAMSSGGSVESNPLFWLGAVVMGVGILIGTFIIYLMFSMSFYIAVDKPELGAVNALKESMEITKGHKQKLFMMFLVFYGWSFLAVFTLFIGMLWVAPYFATSLAKFYDDLKAPATA